MRNVSEQKFREMIYAFSAGCLDRDECMDFIDYLKSGQKVPENELGELQNVVSLLPATLELEVPDVQVKDKVAKRLYRMREELRAKKKQMVKDLAPEEVQPINENVFSEKVYERPEEIRKDPPLKTTGRMTIEGPVNEAEASEKRNRELKKSTIVEVPYTDLDKVEFQAEAPEAESAAPENFNRPARFTSKTMETFTAGPVEEPVNVRPIRPEPQAAEPVKPQRRALDEEEDEEEKSGKSFKNILILSAILVFVLIAGGIIYFLMNREIHQGKSQIASLSGQLNALNSEIVRLDRNQKVLAVLSAKDLRVINLDGTDSNPGGFGKISLLQNGSEGVIQFYNMPVLGENQVYQLWISSKGQYYSLGTFKTKRDIEYFPFSNPEISQNEVDSYLVTLEDGEGKTTPSKKVFLMTALR